MNLNWKELELWVHQVREEVTGLFVEKIIVPERVQAPDGFLKGEWLIRLIGKKREGGLLISVRPRHAYVSWCFGKGPRSSVQASRSPFDLSLSKSLKGTKLLEVEVLPRERVVVFWFSEENEISEGRNRGGKGARLGLVLVLIPAVPEAFLVLDADSEQRDQKRWKILARSRSAKKASEKHAGGSEAESFFQLPDGKQAPMDVQVREEELVSLRSYHQIIEKKISQELFEKRLQLAQQALRKQLKVCRERMKQNETALAVAHQEENWQRAGNLLKAALGQSPEKTQKGVKVFDYHSESWTEVAVDPRLTLQQQAEKYFQNAKRKARRIEEAQNRIETGQEAIQRIEKNLALVLPFEDWGALKQLEVLAGLEKGRESAPAGVGKRARDAELLQGVGKTFVTPEGWLILVGRNRDENREILQMARGNDIWMHLRGRPGAHVMIRVPAGKSVPLETLLDGALLAIHYSGGNHWGKTEVDYTFRKFVKRIKDSTEVSYTQNKTLWVTPDPKRLQKLQES